MKLLISALLKFGRRMICRSSADDPLLICGCNSSEQRNNERTGLITGKYKNQIGRWRLEQEDRHVKKLIPLILRVKEESRMATKSLVKKARLTAWHQRSKETEQEKEREGETLTPKPTPMRQRARVRKHRLLRSGRKEVLAVVVVFIRAGDRVGGGVGAHDWGGGGLASERRREEKMREREAKRKGTKGGTGRSKAAVDYQSTRPKHRLKRQLVEQRPTPTRTPALVSSLDATSLGDKKPTNNEKRNDTHGSGHQTLCPRSAFTPLLPYSRSTASCGGGCGGGCLTASDAGGADLRRKLKPRDQVRELLALKPRVRYLREGPGAVYFTAAGLSCVRGRQGMQMWVVAFEVEHRLIAERIIHLRLREKGYERVQFHQLCSCGHRHREYYFLHLDGTLEDFESLAWECLVEIGERKAVWWVIRSPHVCVPIALQKNPSAAEAKCGVFGQIFQMSTLRSCFLRSRLGFESPSEIIYIVD
ncbi:hypothetical protein C8R45DRAFT_931334 [Mycena sanguinolenta]|nr:hypothetical protein C8R45DRAFT_931334 [Mycena sanguinolenta]